MPNRSAVVLSTAQRRELSIARFAAGLSEVEAGKAIGLAGGYQVEAIENGRRNPSEKVLRKLCGIYGLQCVIESRVVVGAVEHVNREPPHAT